MKRLYVRFAGDNDFSYTVKAFVKAIAPNIFLNYWKNITKAQIVSLFNEHAYSLYCLHQNRDLPVSEEKSKRLKEYLHIGENAVYFDEEIDKFTNFNHDGCLAVLIHHNNEIQYTIM